MLALAGGAHAQDFSGARPTLAPGDVAAMLDDALPAARAAFGAEAASTRWWNLAELDTRALSAGCGVRAARVAAGVSQTGTPELGWQSAAFALGAADAGSGAAVRALVRRELADGAIGAEAGAGAWLRLAPGITLAASAPQLWGRGESPPLARPASAGLSMSSGIAGAWLVLEGPRAGAAGERVFGAGLDAGPARVWAEARGAPWRATLGASAGAGMVDVGVRVDAHPALGETWRAGIAVRRERSGS
jgi:hypothetical protein